MSSEAVPIHRTNADSKTTNKNDVWFNAFDFAPGQDANIRWLSRPNQQLVQQKYSHDTEKFRITFDVENFQPEQIKLYVQNRKLTISGVYEERSEGRYLQKQFERTFDLPPTADVDSMAAFITALHMLVVEIPLNPTAPVDHLNVTSNANNQRRLSFSLNKYNTTDNQGSLSTSNDLTNLSAPGQQVRRTSVTKTVTTTTTGSSGLSPEAADLLRSADTSVGNTSQTYSTHTTERRSSATNNQALVNQPNTSSTTNKQTILTSSELANLPIDIPPELLTTGGTITIQKRKVSISKGTDGTTDQNVSVPSTQSSNTSSTTTSSTHTTNQTTGSVPIQRANDNQSSLSSTKTTNTTETTNQTTGSVPIQRTDNAQSSLSSTTTNNTLNQQQSNLSESLSSKTISSSNQSHMYTLEEFLQNKTWNPSLTDGPNGKKILSMRLQMKPGTKADQMKISLNGHDLRVEVDNKTGSHDGRQMNEHSYRQVTLFPTCEVDQLKTELKDDGYLHIQVPMTL